MPVEKHRLHKLQSSHTRGSAARLTKPFQLGGRSPHLHLLSADVMSTAKMCAVPELVFPMKPCGPDRLSASAMAWAVLLSIAGSGLGSRAELDELLLLDVEDDAESASAVAAVSCVAGTPSSLALASVASVACSMC